MATKAVSARSIKKQHSDVVVLEFDTYGHGRRYCMEQTEQLIEALKRVLKSRGLTYADVAKAIGLSEPSVKRQFSHRSFSLRTLDEICRLAEIDFFDLAKLARKSMDTQETLTVTQEAALAKQPLLLGVFNLLYHEWQPAEILVEYELGKAECTKLLVRLDRLGLIELLPNDRVKVRAPRPLRILPNGPIRNTLGTTAIDDFIAVPFAEHGGYIRFEFREISRASFALLQRKIDRLAVEFNEAAELDSTLPTTQRISIGLMAATRPWNIESITGLRKRR